MCADIQPIWRLYLDQGQCDPEQDLRALAQQTVPNASRCLCWQGARKEAGEPAGGKVLEIQLGLGKSPLEARAALDQQLLQRALLQAAGSILQKCRVI